MLCFDVRLLQPPPDTHRNSWWLCNVTIMQLHVSVVKNEDVQYESITSGRYCKTFLVLIMVQDFV